MASECTYHAQTDDTFRTTKLAAHEHRVRAGYVNGGSAPDRSSAFFEVIGGCLYRRKLEKGFVHYREVLAEDKRLQSIATFHEKRRGKSHHTLEDTYRLVAEHYWWEGMYFQVRDFVLSCDKCQSERSECSDVGLVSRMVDSHSHEILSKLNSQREAGLFCDITLKTGGGQSFVAHKAVLAAVSEYFQELFTEMDSDPQSQVDLTGFSEQSLLALLEFSYTSTLNLSLDSLTEVCAMARHLRMWPALEACSAIRREKETCQLSSKMHSTAGEPNPILGPFRRDSSTTPPGKVGLKRKREDEEEFGCVSSWHTQVQYREHVVDKMLDESGTEILNPQLQCQASSSFYVDENGFPCSPNRRMKLMDFKSPSCKKKLCSRPTPPVISSSPCTSTRSSSPSRRLLRSSPGAALALRRLLPKIDLSSKRKRKSSSYRTYKSQSEFPVTQSQSQATHVTSVKIKEEDLEEEVCNTIPQDEVHSPRAQEKYRLLSFLGLQRKSQVPGPEELSGWGQKKRLRKLKVSDYSLTARRKPRSQAVPLAIGTSLGALAVVSPSLSLCDMSRMDLLNKPIKAEPHEPWNHESFKRKRRGHAGQAVQPSERTTRSKSLLLTNSSATDRPLRRHNRNQDQKNPPQPARRGRVPAHDTYSPSKKMLRIKQEPADNVILQPIQRRNTAYNHQATLNPPKARRGRPPADRTVRVATTKSQQTKQYKVGRPATKKPKSTKQTESKTKCNYAMGITQAKHSKTQRGTQVKENRKSEELVNIKENPEVQYGVMNWDISNTNHQHLHSHPLYKTIKEEPADPLPLTQPFPTSDSSDLGKRQSKPPVKLLDQGFLFGFCRPPSGIKREEESVDIYLTRSVTHGSTSHQDSTPNMVRRDRVGARIKPDRTGLNGPHWAGVGNRSTPFSQRIAFQVKTEREETSVSQRSKVNRVTRRPKVSKRSCKVKKEPTKTKNVNKLLPLSSRRSILLESIRRARVKQMQDAQGQASGGAHACLQCRSSYRDCDALIMHRIRHIEGKHWPCPLCSKTFFRQRNVRNHIRTHNPKLYKCRQCIAAR